MNLAWAQNNLGHHWKKNKGFLNAMQHQEILMTDVGL